MRIVVTGCAGFIGAVVCKIAQEQGHDVLGIDDLSRGLNNINFLGDKFRRHDALGGISEAVQGGKIDAVIHLAAATGSLERPIEELRLYNVEMMHRVYVDAVRLGAKAFLWPTTSLALGVPDSPYVLAKEEGLARLLEIDRANEIAQPVRFFNVAGAYKGLTERRRKEVHAIPMMLEAYLTNKAPFIVNGDDYNTDDGTPSRDFVNVVDVAEFLLKVAAKKLEGVRYHAAKDGAIWCGTGQATTVKQAIQIFERFVGPLKHEVGPRRAYDCGALLIDWQQAEQFRAVRRGVVPAWVSIRDEVLALLDNEDLEEITNPGKRK